MNTSRVNLEQFEGSGGAIPLESPEYKRGKADGIAHAETLNSTKIAHSIDEISSTLNDMAFGYEEARLHILEQFHPLVRQLSEQVLPEIAKEAFGAHLLEAINFELQKSATLPVQIGIAPGLIPTLAGLKHFDHCNFVADPNLEAGQAVIVQNDLEVLLDLPALIHALQTALNGLEGPERSIRNG